MEDHQGKEVANEVFSQTWLAAESMSCCDRVTLVVINQVGAEGTIDFLSLKILFRFISFLGGPPAHCPSLLGSCSVVEGGFHFGVNLPS